MKSLEIIQSLDQREKLELDNVIENKARISLQNLWNSLRTRLPEDREKRKRRLFQDVFGEDWSEEKDYLLRNELRILTGTLEDWLVEKSIRQKLRKDREFYQHHLAGAFRDRNLDGPYLRLVHKMQRDAPAASAHSVIDWEIRRRLDGDEVTMENYREIRDLCDDRLLRLKREFVQKLRQVEEQRAMAERVLAILHPEDGFSRPEIQLDLLSNGLNTAESLYRYHRSRSYALQGNAAIDARKLALENLLKSEIPVPEKQPKVITEMAGIALLHTFSGEKAEAANWYEKMLEYAEIEQVSVPVEILFNLFSFRVKDGAYRSAIQIYDAFEAEILKNEKLKYRFLCVKGMCHNFLGEPGAALRSIDPEIQQRPSQENYYFRLVEIIAWYLKDMPEDAIRTARNLQKTVQYQPVKRFDMPYPEIARWFGLFFQASTEAGEKKSGLMTRLAGEIKTGEAAILPAHRSFLPLMWLKAQIFNEN